MKDWADLLHAIAALLWPVLAFLTVLIFRQHFRDLLSRLKKGKFFGQELELDVSLTNLEAKSTVIASEVFPVPASSTSKEELLRQSRETEKVLELASRSPKAALMLLASEIERQLRVFMATTGHHSMMKERSLGAIASYLGRTGWLTTSMIETIDLPPI